MNCARSSTKAQGKRTKPTSACVSVASSPNNRAASWNLRRLRPARRRTRTRPLPRRVSPWDWQARIMWAVDQRPATLAALAGRLAGASGDPAFARALDALRAQGLLGEAPLTKGQRIARLVRRWPCR
jgi:hypothetical protein